MIDQLLPLMNKNGKNFNDVGKENPVKNTWANI